MVGGVCEHYCESLFFLEYSISRGVELIEWVVWRGEGDHSGQGTPVSVRRPLVHRTRISPALNMTTISSLLLKNLKMRQL